MATCKFIFFTFPMVRYDTVSICKGFWTCRKKGTATTSRGYGMPIHLALLCSYIQPWIEYQSRLSGCCVLFILVETKLFTGLMLHRKYYGSPLRWSLGAALGGHNALILLNIELSSHGPFLFSILHTSRRQVSKVDVCDLLHYTTIDFCARTPGGESEMSL
ncbi:hypothetical protein NEOLEDRAFT_135796 [Neolentinus lepideus HHB14362 ss-1]|uniref:Uncharacterized protein n=1 Tax=Neolentinus lepideus HHB14362 ss-1 TaxID=1314782 RepID=A0A165TY85_9AGAM|nr:hypothetical protein NEOLEDRAFT_135796 [Neolentinus lepideus HHB14362 ss-1]